MTSPGQPTLIGQSGESVEIFGWLTAHNLFGPKESENTKVRVDFENCGIIVAIQNRIADDRLDMQVVVRSVDMFNGSNNGNLVYY